MNLSKGDNKTQKGGNHLIDKFSTPKNFAFGVINQTIWGGYRDLNPS